MSCDGQKRTSPTKAQYLIRGIGVWLPIARWLAPVPFPARSFALCEASIVGCHGQAQRGHVLRKAKHARAYGLGVALRETQDVTGPY